jgi:hypothetical protein
MLHCVMNAGHATLSDAEFDALQPFRWSGVSPFAARPFSTPNGGANLIAAA